MAQGLPLWLCAGTGDAFVDALPECTPCRGGFVCDEPVSCLAAVAASNVSETAINWLARLSCNTCPALNQHIAGVHQVGIRKAHHRMYTKGIAIVQSE